MNTCILFEASDTVCVHTIGIQRTGAVVVISHYWTTAHATFSITRVLQSIIARWIPPGRTVLSCNIIASRTVEALIVWNNVTRVAANLS